MGIPRYLGIHYLADEQASFLTWLNIRVVESMTIIKCYGATLNGSRWMSELGEATISAAVFNSLKVMLPNPKSLNFCSNPIFV